VFFFYFFLYSSHHSSEGQRHHAAALYIHTQCRVTHIHFVCVCVCFFLMKFLLLCSNLPVQQQFSQDDSSQFLFISIENRNNVYMSVHAYVSSLIGHCAGGQLFF
jgi:hypothetical protein